MPVNTVHRALLEILDGLILPGTTGTLAAFITPPDPRDDPPPAIYLWASRGSERRQALPRGNTPGAGSLAGWKEIDHIVEGYLTWFGEDTDPDADTNFPAVLDAVMFALRTSGQSPLYTSDPLTGLQSDLVDIGERIEYELVPPRSTANQRYLRYDALLTIHVLEFFQA
jgi:hypothetical protein